MDLEFNLMHFYGFVGSGYIIIKIFDYFTKSRKVRSECSVNQSIPENEPESFVIEHEGSESSESSESESYPEEQMVLRHRMKLRT